MKLLSKVRWSFFWHFNWNHPILLLDVYRHSFTFVTIKDPRTETGITFVVSILKLQANLSFYVDKPYEVRSKIMKRIRERQNGEKT